MSETKFTPGTWAWSEIDPEDKEWGACEVFRDELNPEFVATHVCGAANAALIAAAPDLYAALEALCTSGGLDDGTDVIGKGLTALAKARGEA